MLVLTRRQGESIVIGDDIKVTVVNLGPGRVKLGIEAPARVRVNREEIHARIVQEQSTDVLAAVAAEASGDHSNGPNTTQLSKTEVLSVAPRKPR